MQKTSPLTLWKVTNSLPDFFPFCTSFWTFDNDGKTLLRFKDGGIVDVTSRFHEIINECEIIEQFKFDVGDRIEFPKEVKFWSDTKMLAMSCGFTLMSTDGISCKWITDEGNVFDCDIDYVIFDYSLKKYIDGNTLFNAGYFSYYMFSDVEKTILSANFSFDELHVRRVVRDFDHASKGVCFVSWKPKLVKKVVMSIANARLHILYTRRLFNPKSFGDLFTKHCIPRKEIADQWLANSEIVEIHKNIEVSSRLIRDIPSFCDIDIDGINVTLNMKFFDHIFYSESLHMNVLDNDDMKKIVTSAYLKYEEK